MDIANIDNEDLPTINSTGSCGSRRKKGTVVPAAAAGSSAELPTNASSLSDGKLLQVLAARAVDSEGLKKKLEDMLGIKDFNTAERINWGQWFASCAGQIPAVHWGSFRQESLDLIWRYLPSSRDGPDAPIPVSAPAPAPVSRSMSAPSSSSAFSAPTSLQSSLYGQQGGQQLSSSVSGQSYMRSQQSSSLSGYYGGYCPPTTQPVQPQPLYSPTSAMYQQGQQVVGQSASSQPSAAGQVQSYSPSSRVFSNLSTPELNSANSSVVANSALVTGSSAFSPNLLSDSFSVLQNEQDDQS